MPPKIRKTKHTDKDVIKEHLVFFPLLTLTFVLWVLYRALLSFPVWFDESFGKAIFFGLPVWLYLVITQSESIKETFSFKKFQSGLMLGLAVGGVFGFTTTVMMMLQSGSTPQAAALFTSNEFWREFLLAFLTAFWETLIFFSFIMVVVQEKYVQKSLSFQLLLVVIIFMLFHLPNIVLRFEGVFVLSQVLLLTLFALGQALFFASKRNFYALVISHSIWGMVLLVHGQ